MQIVPVRNVQVVSISSRLLYHWVNSGLIQGQYKRCVTIEILLEHAEVLKQHRGDCCK